MRGGRAMRGRGAPLIRGGISQPLEQVQSTLPPVTAPETTINKEPKEQIQKEEEKLQQPAIQIPKENNLQKHQEDQNSKI